jgi:hypothetical protein
MRIFVCGAVLFLGSNFLGHGIAYRPDPVQGLLLAGAGMLICGKAIGALLVGNQLSQARVGSQGLRKFGVAGCNSEEEAYGNGHGKS